MIFARFSFNYFPQLSHMTPFVSTPKSLLGALAVAALGLASGAQAAEVSMYGIVDPVSTISALTTGTKRRAPFR